MSHINAFRKKKINILTIGWAIDRRSVIAARTYKCKKINKK